MSVAATACLHLDARHISTVQEILRAHVPDREVWVFGSRATGVQLKQFSDLDLAISGELSLEQKGALAEAFEESLLPMKVDIVTLGSLPADFAERIKPDLLPFSL
jgi:predicted nucleotidyltransferase